MGIAIRTNVTWGPDHGHHDHDDHGGHGHDFDRQSVEEYADRLVDRFDSNRDGRIDRREQRFAGPRAIEFFRSAEGGNHGDHGHDDSWALDRGEVRRAVEWQIDRNHDRMIDGFERRAAAEQFGF